MGMSGIESPTGRLYCCATWWRGNKFKSDVLMVLICIFGSDGAGGPLLGVRCCERPQWVCGAASVCNLIPCRSKLLAQSIRFHLSFPSAVVVAQQSVVSVVC